MIDKQVTYDYHLGTQLIDIVIYISSTAGQL